MAEAAAVGGAVVAYEVVETAVQVGAAGYMIAKRKFTYFAVVQMKQMD